MYEKEIKRAESEVEFVKNELLSKNYDFAIAGSWVYGINREKQFELAKELGKRMPDLDIITTKPLHKKDIENLQRHVDLSLDFWELPKNPVVTIYFDAFDGAPMPYEEKLIQLRNMLSLPIEILRDNGEMIKAHQTYVTAFNTYFALGDVAKNLEEIFDKVRSENFLLQADERPLPNVYYKAFSFIPIEKGKSTYKNGLEELLEMGITREKDGKFELKKHKKMRLNHIPSSSLSLSDEDIEIIKILNEAYKQKVR
jgi:hypothetical protein